MGYIKRVPHNVYLAVTLANFCIAFIVMHLQYCTRSSATAEMACVE